MKKLFVFGLMAAVLPAFAEEVADRKTATSLKYVEHELDTRQNKFTAESNKAMEYTDSAGDVQKRAVKSDLGSDTSDTSLPMVGGVNTKLATKQDDIAPINDHTAVTYTGQSGSIGQKGIYQTNESYADQSDNLIDAKTFNAALKKGLDSEFLCSEYKPGTDLCWVWSIHNTGDDALPSDYTPLEYIVSDAHQYINTEISPTADTFYKLEVMFADRGNGYRFFGTGNGGALTGFGSGSNNLYVNSLSTPLISDVSNLFNQKMIIDYKGTNVNINGVNYTCAQAQTTSVKMYINARADSLNTRVGAGKWYRVTIGSGTTVLADFVPAQNASGVAGMYDLVRRRFFPSTSGTNFTAGPEKDAPFTTLVPAGYTPVEYIESNGYQYIDTGIKGHMDYTYELDFQQKNANQYRNWGVLNQSSYVGQNMSFTYVGGWGIRWDARQGGQSVVSLPSIDTSRHTLRIVDGEAYFDGVDKGRSEGHDSSFVFNYNLFLGTANPAGTTPTSNANSKYYSYRVWDANGNLIQNFIPARQDSDNKVGMYDTVSGRFFPSVPANTNFAAGPEISNIVYIPQNQ